MNFLGVKSTAHPPIIGIKNFFDGIYYAIWHLELFGRNQLKKNILYV